MLLSILFAAFVFGVVQLFVLRFKAGDVYPEYSSLRADPLGVKALYDGLHGLRSLSVSRNYQPLPKLRDSGAATLFYFGAHPADMDRVRENFAKGLETFVGRGGRLVISFFPMNKKPRSSTGEETEEQNTPKDKGREEDLEKLGKERRKKNRDEDSSGSFIRSVSLADRWGFDLDFADLPKARAGAHASIVARKEIGGLPGSISWHSMLVFKGLDPTWRVIYQRANLPVIIERTLEKGTIVLTADSYFVSNEAMRWERHPALLAWLVQPNREVIFEETHLGITENPGIVTLARRYRLHGLFAWILLLAGLFVWKNSVAFIPPHESDLAEEETDIVGGRDSVAGLKNLLRRSVSVEDILAVCLREWKNSYARAEKQFPGKLERAQAVVDREKARPAKQRNPVRSYQIISQILAREGIEK